MQNLVLLAQTAGGDATSAIQWLTFATLIAGLASLLVAVGVKSRKIDEMTERIGGMKQSIEEVQAESASHLNELRSIVEELSKALASQSLTIATNNVKIEAEMRHIVARLDRLESREREVAR